MTGPNAKASNGLGAMTRATQLIDEGRIALSVPSRLLPGEHDIVTCSISKSKSQFDYGSGSPDVMELMAR